MKSLLPFLVLLVSGSCIAQAGTEILLFDITTNNGVVTITNGKNITLHKGYDNQPHFHPAKPLIYYASFDDSGRSDLKYYDYTIQQTSNLTTTNEREYSPTVTPDGNFISCIIQRDNGIQDLGKYPISGGKPEVLIDHLKVGYHAWASADELILFILDDSVNNSLHYYNLKTKTDTILAKNIGRSLHKIPGQNAMSFVQRTSDSSNLIKRFNLTTKAITTIVHTVPGQDALTWLKDGTILMSNGKGLYSYNSLRNKEWMTVNIQGDTSMLKGITRLATNTDNTKLAVVVTE